MINSLNMNNTKKLHRILVRFFPPGIILEFIDKDGMVDTKSIDLLNLSEGYFEFYFLNYIIQI